MKILLAGAGIFAFGVVPDGSVVKMLKSNGTDYHSGIRVIG
jgi:hypothetical protein